MLPKSFQEWHTATYRPIDINENKAQSIIHSYSQDGDRNNYIYELIVTMNESIIVLNKMGINKTTAFYEFYSTFFSVDSSEQEADLMYDLNEIYENYKQPFWADKYPNIQERYLQISSIEGEGSYFYDKQTDYLYDVAWKDMDDFINGKLKPLFISFYDFLEWYYSE